MHSSLRTAIVVLGALSFAAAAEAGGTTFKGKVCSIVSSKALLTVQGISTACTEQAPLPSPGGKDYVGNWKGLTPTRGIQITIEAFTDTGMLKRATQNLREGLVASPKKVTGIGQSAYESKGADAVEVKAAVGNYIAIVVLTDVKKPPQSPALIEPLAKAVVAAL